MNKWLHYFDIYERHFEKYRDTEVTIIEIGVAGGGSLQMWKQYFGPKARIIGVDISKDCYFKEAQIEVLIGDQRDRAFLKTLPEADIVIDDGKHRPEHQITSFEVLYPKTKGVYLIEDTHTAFWEQYSGGIGKPQIIEHAKKNIDRLHAWHTNEIRTDEFVQTTQSIHFYDSIIVYEKGAVTQPESRVV